MRKESKDLRTVFSYYGGKAAIANKYPPPMYPVIVEPFAGSAAYSQLHHYCKVFLFDVDPDIVATWEFLIKASARDILALPDVDFDTDTSRLDIPRGAQALIGYSIKEGNQIPTKRPNCRTFRGDLWNSRKVKVAKIVHRFNHWEVRLASWELLRSCDFDATWFIDPPYQFGGDTYRCSVVDRGSVLEFIKTRSGQIISCENSQADWMPVTSIVGTMQGTQNKNTTEVMWYRHNSAAEKQLLSKVYTKKLRSVIR
jgi:hypothetical protein